MRAETAAVTVAEGVKAFRELPEGCELRLDLYVTSPSEGINVVIGLGGMTRVPSVDHLESDALGLARALGAELAPLDDMASDWRLMSRAEVEVYKLVEAADHSEDEEPGF